VDKPDPPKAKAGRMTGFCFDLVPRRGLEPPRLAALVPETSASTNSAIWASDGSIPASCAAEKQIDIGCRTRCASNAAAARGAKRKKAIAQKNDRKNKKADAWSAFLQNWCPEEDSNLHASQR